MQKLHGSWALFVELHIQRGACVFIMYIHYECEYMPKKQAIFHNLYYANERQGGVYTLRGREMYIQHERFEWFRVAYTRARGVITMQKAHSRNVTLIPLSSAKCLIELSPTCDNLTRCEGSFCGGCFLHATIWHVAGMQILWVAAYCHSEQNINDTIRLVLLIHIVAGQCSVWVLLVFFFMVSTRLHDWTLTVLWADLGPSVTHRVTLKVTHLFDQRETR